MEKDLKHKSAYWMTTYMTAGMSFDYETSHNITN